MGSVDMGSGDHHMGSGDHDYNDYKDYHDYDNNDHHDKDDHHDKPCDGPNCGGPSCENAMANWREEMGKWKYMQSGMLFGI